jgi:hypothetical protein
MHGFEILARKISNKLDPTIDQAIQKLAKNGGMTEQDAIRQLQPLFEESNTIL